MDLGAAQIPGLVAGLAVVTYTLVRVASRRQPALVIVSTALVALALVAAWIAAPERGDSLLPILGAAVGALAAGVAAVTGGKDD
jgi:hypothetical protein